MAPESNARYFSLDLLKGRRDICYLVVCEDRLPIPIILVFINSIVHNSSHPESLLVGDKGVLHIFICTSVIHRERNVTLHQVGGRRILGRRKFPTLDTRLFANFGRVRPDQADKSEQPNDIHCGYSQHDCQVSGCLLRIVPLCGSPGFSVHDVCALWTVSSPNKMIRISILNSPSHTYAAKLL